MILYLWASLVLYYADALFYIVQIGDNLNIKTYRDPNGYFRMITYTSKHFLPTTYSDFDADILQSIYVGGRENLYRFQLGDISKVTKQNFPSSEEHYKICIGISNNNFDNNVECKNQVWNVLFTHDKRLIVCESQNFQPKLRYTNLTTLEPLTDKAVPGIEGDGYTTCDARPTLSEGNLFSMQFSVDDKTFSLSYIRFKYRYDISGFLNEITENIRVYKNTVNRTMKYRDVDMQLSYENFYQLQDGIFVRSMIIGEFVYLFFTEITNLEVQYGDPDIIRDTRVSRVSRFCKNDVGWEEAGISYITSFTKTRIQCQRTSKDGSDIIYMLIKDVVYDETKKEFIALFYKSSDSIDTALCSFTLKIVDEALSHTLFTKYTYPGDSATRSINRTRMSQVTCPGKKYSNRLINYSLRATVSFKNLLATLLFKIPSSETFAFLLSSTKSNGDRLLYAFDKSDIMWKFSQSNNGKLILVSKQKTNIKNINNVMMIDDQIYGISDTAVFFIEIADQCSSHVSCFTCATDLHCMWSTATISKCVTYDKNKLSNAIRNLNGDIFEQCLKDCQVHPEVLKIPMKGAATILPYKNKCTDSYRADTDAWTNENGNIISIDNINYGLSLSGNLLIMYTNETMTYKLTRNNFRVKTIKVEVTECSSPTCHFREEFAKWCRAFSNYKNDYNNWRCLKDNCENDPNCIPKTISNTCANP